MRRVTIFSDPFMEGVSMGSEFSVDQLLQVLWRRRLVIAGITFVLIIAVYVLVKQLPEGYTAEGLLQIEASPFVFTESQSGAGGDPTVDIANVHSATLVLHSWDLLAETARKLNLQANPEFNPTLPDPDANWIMKIRPRAWIETLLAMLPLIPQKPPGPVTQA